MPESKSGALPLGYSPMVAEEGLAPSSIQVMSLVWNYFQSFRLVVLPRRVELLLSPYKGPVLTIRRQEVSWQLFLNSAKRICVGCAVSITRICCGTLTTYAATIVLSDF